MQFAHAHCLSEEVDSCGGAGRSELPARVHWPDGFSEIYQAASLNAVRLREFYAIAQQGGDTPQRIFKEGGKLDPDHLPPWMDTPEMRQAMSTLNTFSEKENAYYAYQARLEYQRVQRAMQQDMEERTQALEQTRAELEQSRAAAEQARAAEEQARAAEEQARAAAEQARAAEGQARAAEGQARAEREQARAAEAQALAAETREREAKEQEREAKERALAEVERLRRQLDGR